MADVLETLARPDTAEARRAGDIVLCAGLLAFGALVVAASVAARPAPRPPAEVRGTRLPVEAEGARGAAAFIGMQTSGERMRLAAGAGENGVVATLRGGERWRDVSVRARVRWLAGDELAVHVRETGPESYVACVLGGGRARIEEVRGGVTRVVASRPARDRRGTFVLTAAVTGTAVRMDVDGVTAVNGTLEHTGAGTTGVAVWSGAVGEAHAEIERVRVEHIGG